MDSVKHKIYIFLFFGAFFGCSPLQTGIVARYFIKTSVRLDDLASRVRAVFSEHVRVTSSAMCATTCSETEWCSGYLVCKDRPKTLCVLLQVGANSGPATQNTSDYSSCSLYMPSDFRWTNETNVLSTTASSSTSIISMSTTPTSSTSTPSTSASATSASATSSVTSTSAIPTSSTSTPSTSASATSSVTSTSAIPTSSPSTPSTSASATSASATSSVTSTIPTSSTSTPSTSASATSTSTTSTSSTSTLSTLKSSTSTSATSTSAISSTSSTTTSSTTATPFVQSSICNGTQVQPSTSNGCKYGLKSGCNSYYKDCQESSHHKDEAVYLIKPDGYPMPFKVHCSGGDRRRKPRITHIQRNFFSCCPTTSFNQSWAAYRDGFGDLETFSCNYWLGNEKIAAITAQRKYQLVIATRSRHPNRRAIYNDFYVEKESSNFLMRYSSYRNRHSGLNDGFTTVNTPNQDLNGAQFYTYDHDNGAKCAASQGSGWWFDAGCARVNLNTDHDPQWYYRKDLKTYKDMYMGLH